MSSNDLRVAGAKAMASLLSHDQLKSLELASNRLHDFGIKAWHSYVAREREAFGPVLERNRHLTFLGLAAGSLKEGAWMRGE